MGVEPMLRAVGEPEGWDRLPRKQSARVKFSDGQWRSCLILGWRHREDEWYAHLQWPGGRREWRAYDVRFIRAE